MNSLDLQVELIRNYHDVGADHDEDTCRICFLLSEIERWKVAHHTQVEMKRRQGQMVRAIIDAIKRHGFKISMSRSAGTVEVEFSK